MKQLSRWVTKLFGSVLPSCIGTTITRMFSGTLINQIKDKTTDSFVELLFHGMDICFCLSRSFRNNLKGYRGNILLCTKNGAIQVGVRFSHNNMSVTHGSFDDWDARVQFRNPEAFRSFLFSKNQDILKSILENDVAVDGNLNHIYKLSFMARDLAARFSIF